MIQKETIIKTAKGLAKHFICSRSDYDFLKELTGIGRSEYKQLKSELYRDKDFFHLLEDKYYLIRNKKICIKKYESWNKLIYYLVRILTPEIIIETGVFDGITTAFFLKALEENKKGHLYSIDLPAYETIQGSTHRMKFTTLPRGLDVGWIIPWRLRKNWTLFKGPSSEHLSPLLEKVGKVDFFLHDSLHTYDNMTYEYETAWPYIAEGGLLASDDILWNTSFLDFSKKVNRDFLGKYHWGILKK